MKASGDRRAARLAARFAAAMCGRLALIDKAGAECAGDVLERRALIVAVIAVGFAGQQHMPGVMIVVVPLGAVFAARRIFAGLKQARGIVVVFEHQMDVPAGLRGERRPPPC